MDRKLQQRTHDLTHVDGHDDCPFCAADELDRRAEAQWERVHEYGVTGDRGLDTMTGILARGAFRKQDMAEGLRNGTLELVGIEDGKTSGRVITVRRAEGGK